MNRKYTREEYIKKIKYLKKMIPDATLSTDILVGFPGETDEDYKLTVELVNQIEFNRAFMFKYSPRKFTRAFELKERVDEKE